MLYTNTIQEIIIWFPTRKKAAYRLFFIQLIWNCCFWFCVQMFWRKYIKVSPFSGGASLNFIQKKGYWYLAGSFFSLFEGATRKGRGPRFLWEGSIFWLSQRLCICCIGDKDKMNNFLIVTGITLHTVSLYLMYNDKSKWYCTLYSIPGKHLKSFEGVFLQVSQVSYVMNCFSILYPFVNSL